MTEEELLEQCTRDIEAAYADGASVDVNFSAATAFLLIAQLQLALRHPNNTGLGAEKARQLIAALASVACTTPATQELLRRGFDPAYDVIH